MTSSRPYLIRAVHEWIVDNSLTPYILVNAEFENVVVPTQFVEEGKIILNVSLQAVKNLELTNEWVMFNARFSGVSMAVSLPPTAVLAIYAKENGRGMVFSDDDLDGGSDEPTPQPVPKRGKPSLSVVK